MPARKHRIAVVLDTNVLITNYLATRSNSPANRIINLWRKQRELQLIVSDEIVVEYLEILARMDIPQKMIDTFSERIEKRRTVSIISLGKRAIECRDADDNLFLSTAQAGRVEFLITNDKDLLELSEMDKKKFKFRIVTPAGFLAAIAE